MKRKLAHARMFFLSLGLAGGAVTFYFSDPAVVGNTEALRILVTIFSILAGMLIAIVTLLGDPSALYAGSWRVASAHRRERLRVLARCEWLFYIYLCVITMAVIAALVVKFTPDNALAHWFERGALSLGVAALLWSFGLPRLIIKAQRDRLIEEVDRRRPGAQASSGQQA